MGVCSNPFRSWAGFGVISTVCYLCHNLLAMLCVALWISLQGFSQSMLPAWLWGFSLPCLPKIIFFLGVIQVVEFYSNVIID
jgi:hypothetical protein